MASLSSEQQEPEAGSALLTSTAVNERMATSSIYNKVRTFLLATVVRWKLDSKTAWTNELVLKVKREVVKIQFTFHI